AADKLAGYGRLLDETSYLPQQVCYAGDDLPDLPVLRQCGLAVTVADACPEVRGTAHYITRARGGGGALREIVELILNGQGLWSQVVSRLSPSPLAGEG